MSSPLPGYAHTGIYLEKKERKKEGKTEREKERKKERKKERNTYVRMRINRR